MRVADGVSALTKDRSLPKAEQLQDSLRRIVGCPKEIWMVKMADRITNLLPPPSTWPPDKIAAYHRDARVIHATLRDANRELAARLDEKIGGYQAYV
jgi:(p)ppGpp synthase/HD superfamily hydrolase